MKRREYFFNSIYKASITVILKPDTDDTHEQKKSKRVKGWKNWALLKEKNCIWKYDGDYIHK